MQNEAYLLGGDKAYETDVLWFKREHRLNLLSVLPTIFGTVQGSGWWGVADLEREPDNESDPNAVVVQLLGKPVGYLPGDQAVRLAAWIDGLIAAGSHAQARCHVRVDMGQAAVKVGLSS